MTNTDPSRNPRPRVRALFVAFVILGFPLIAFFAIEGVASLALLLNDVLAIESPPVAEGFSEYDPDLGWRSRRGVRDPNFYGPGIALTTNDRGFRGGPVDSLRPAGQSRIICSGDSFTHGFGVSDSETWCHLLSSPTRQSVNMGHSGYGLDQVFLWYKRDGVRIEHDLQVLAIIGVDFLRMQVDRFLGAYPKPVLTVKGDSLVVTNVPVSRRRGSLERTLRLQRFQDLRASQFIARVKSRLDTRDAPDADPQYVDDVFRLLLTDLVNGHRRRGSNLLVVHLPEEADFLSERNRAFASMVQTRCDSLGVRVINLIPTLRELKPAEMKRLFLARGSGRFAFTDMHYSAEGNRWVARQLRATVDSLVLVATRNRAGN